MTGTIQERTPAIKNGLVAYFPFDGSEIGKNFRNQLRMTDWKVGTSGSQGMFGQNGSSSENEIISYENPWGDMETMWATLANDEASGADGGWNVTGLPIDNTKKYRLSVWIKRDNVGNGTTYFGCQGSSVSSLGSTTANTNPYFTNGKFTETYGEWVLFVAYIHPHSYSGGNDPTNGLYKLNGQRTRGISDYKWLSTSTTGGHRTYLYYSTSTTEKQYWCRPRFELCDGNESTIEELLRGEDDFFHTTANSQVSFTDKGAGIEYGTTNLATGTVGVYSGYHSHTREGQTIRFTMIGDNKPIVFNIGQSLTGKTLAISGYMKRNGTPAFISSRASTYNNAADSKKIHFDAETGYFEIVENYTHATSSWVMHASTSFKDGDVVTIEELQVEERNYGTSYTPSVRSGNGLLRIDNLGGFTNYTVCGTFYPRTPLDATYDYTVSGASLLRVEDSVNNGGCYFRYYVSGSNSAPYLDPDGIYNTSGGSGHIHRYYQVFPNEEVFYAITKSGGSISIRVYQRGQLLDEHSTTSINSIARLDNIVLGGTTIWNGSHKDIAVYNRALSVGEIEKIGKPGFSLTRFGELVSTVLEYPAIMLIEDETKNITDNTYRSMGTWNVVDKDFSRFVEANNELGSVYFTAEVFLSDAQYYPSRFEFTRENNTKGINQDVVPPQGGWKVGWNRVFFKAVGYADAVNTPWADMSRFETYRSGDATGTDSNQYIRLRNVQVVKAPQYDKWMKYQKKKLRTTEVREGRVL